jgi:hypothetical protein
MLLEVLHSRIRPMQDQEGWKESALQVEGLAGPK